MFFNKKSFLVLFLFLAVFALSISYLVYLNTSRCDILSWTDYEGLRRVVVFYPRHPGCHKCNALVAYKFALDNGNKILAVEGFIENVNKIRLIDKKSFIFDEKNSTSKYYLVIPEVK